MQIIQPTSGRSKFSKVATTRGAACKYRRADTNMREAVGLLWRPPKNFLYIEYYGSRDH